MCHKIVRSAFLAILIVSPLEASTTLTYEPANLAPSTHLNHTPYTEAGITHSNAFYDWGGGFTSWDGFAISNHTDNTTPGYGNQYSAFPGSGAGNSSHYAVAYVATSLSTRLVFPDPTVLTGASASFANTTYTALSMRDGDWFSKKFGGSDGSDPDFLLLTLTGFFNGLATGNTHLYLADFRGAPDSDHILATWQSLDLSPLGTVDEIRFTMASSDNGPFGMNTPAYFAMDNLHIPFGSPVPESSTALFFAAGALAILRRQRPSPKAL